jgi:hypothetical protein
MPGIFDELLDQMALSFETSFNAYCQSQWDYIHEECLCRHLFHVVIGLLLLGWLPIFSSSPVAQLHMEHVLFWLSRMGFWVSWSVQYDQLLVRFFPEVYPDTLEASQASELARFRSRLLSFQRPSSGPRAMVLHPSKRPQVSLVFD